jgi:hypothetical protein
MATTESGRIAALQSATRRCDAAAALARANRLRPSQPCCQPQQSVLGLQVQSEGARLTGQTATCGLTAYTSPFECVPESIRIARQAREVQDCFTPPTVRPEPCPPYIYNPQVFNAAGEVVSQQPALGGNISGQLPFLQGRNCPLPNKPDNPVLPG